jgi:hypothetical protein
MVLHARWLFNNLLDRARRTILPVAINAQAINLESMPRGPIVELTANLLLQAVDLGGKEFDGTAATRAHHVVVTAPIVLVLEARLAVVELDFAGQATLRQQLERAVDRCDSDPCIFLLDQAMEFFGGEMLSGFEETLQNGVALCRLLKPHALEMLAQDFLRLTQHLGRDYGMIVNTFVQHGDQERLSQH